MGAGGAPGLGAMGCSISPLLQGAEGSHWGRNRRTDALHEDLLVCGRKRQLQKSTLQVDTQQEQEKNGARVYAYSDSTPCLD